MEAKYVQPDYWDKTPTGKLTVFMCCPHCKGILSEDKPHKCDDYVEQETKEIKVK